MTILEPWRGNDALKFVIPGLERSGEGYDVYTMCTENRMNFRGALAS